VSPAPPEDAEEGFAPSGEAVPEEEEPALDTDGEVETSATTWRQKAKSKNHLMDHDSFNCQCPGCNAKARNKRRVRGSFEPDDPRHANEITMDQVSMTDLDGTMGIGKFRYAIVFCKVQGDYWSFIPLKTLEAKEADLAFLQFATGPFADMAQVLVYCDAHASLFRICDNHGLRRRHPPPGRPQSNIVIERKIGVALAGIRAYLVTGGTPNCFWPFIGHAFSVKTSVKSPATMRRFPASLLKTALFPAN